MKVYVTDEKELIMEPSIKWAGNPNITVAVKAFGLKATAQVIDCSAVEEKCFNMVYLYFALEGERFCLLMLTVLF